MEAVDPETNTSIHHLSRWLCYWCCREPHPGSQLRFHAAEPLAADEPTEFRDLEVVGWSELRSGVERKHDDVLQRQKGSEERKKQLR
jgi:hypothetical protein